MASKGKPYRKVDVEGFEVLIGRGARENDALTFGVGKPPDTWLHVAGGTPGSHVIIRNPEKDAVPRSVIERAARFAAWFSKARDGGWVEVHYCKVADVRKPKGAPAGLVQLLRYQKVRVRPEPPNADDDPAAASDQNEGSD
jgi:predicted ribosome quality control (RQC) complex YloA/Tae2 family protein